MKKIDKLQARVAQLLERIRLNNEAHERHVKAAFAAGYCSDVAGVDNAFNEWRARLEAEGIKASMDAGREP
jgi:hypothetical protein